MTLESCTQPCRPVPHVFSRTASLAMAVMAICSHCPGAPTDPEAQAIIESMAQRKLDRWSQVQDNYTITLSVRDSGGLQTPVYYVRDGAIFRVVSQVVYEREMMAAAGFAPVGPETLEGLAGGLGMIGSLFSGMGGNPFPFDVAGMTGRMEDMLLSAGNGLPGDSRAEAQDEFDDLEAFSMRARLVGTEMIQASGDLTPDDPPVMREAFLLEADDLSDVELEQPDSGATFTLDRTRLWVDTEFRVPIRLLMEGKMAKGKDVTPITIEKLDLDYRAEGPLYESHQRVYRLGGILSGMTEKQKKEIRKARDELAKLKQQLEAMPASQKAMVMKMMGPQMDKIEKMAEGGDISSIVDVASIAVDEGPPTPYGLGALIVGGPFARDYPGALTLASENDSTPALTAELGISARQGSASASFDLKSDVPYPSMTGEIRILDASGRIEQEGQGGLSIEGGEGTITVTEQTATRIAGTFSAILSCRDDNGSTVIIPVEGMFDSGAPAGPYQGLRGSPIPGRPLPSL